MVTNVWSLNVTDRSFLRHLYRLKCYKVTACEMCRTVSACTSLQNVCGNDLTAGNYMYVPSSVLTMA
jgi:hypothetical protein